MGTGSPRPRRASTAKSPNQDKMAAGKDREDAEMQAAAAAAADSDGDDGCAAAAAPPPAKRARKERQPARGGRGSADEAVDADADADAAEASAKPAPARSRKSRSKAAASEAAPEEDEGGAEGAGALLGDRAAKPQPQSKPRAKAQAKRGQKAQVEPLPQYTAALRKPPPPPPPPGGTPALKLLSWNVAGLRALLKKQPDAISSLVEREGVEVVCLQEHKLQSSHTAEMEAALGLKGWHHHWACSSGKLGYSGVSVHTRTKPLSVSIGLGGAGSQVPDPEHDLEGRVVAVELPAAHVVSAYVPNSGEGLKRLDYRVKRWDGAFATYIQELEARGKPVILTGDLNCAHQEIDIHAPKTNLRSAGFTAEERESFGRLLLGEVGLVDTFRRLFPDTVAYTYFTRRFNCRAQNKGWRLDYFLTSGALMPSAATMTAAAAVTAAAEQQAPEVAAAVVTAAPAAPALSTPWRVYDSWILQDVYGSDHLPLGLTLICSPE